MVNSVVRKRQFFVVIRVGKKYASLSVRWKFHFIAKIAKIIVALFLKDLAILTLSTASVA